jgi:C1A family cysteine protease
MKKTLPMKKLIFLFTLISFFIISMPVYSAISLDSQQDQEYCTPCSPYSLGELPLDESTRSSINFIALSLPTNDLPDSFDWRTYKGGDWTTPIRNQGQCGSCWAFGAIGALEAAINIEYNDSNIDIDLSEQYLVSCGPGHGCDGGPSMGALDWMKRTGGALPESCFPYEAADLPCDQKCANWKDLLLPVKEYWVAEYASDEEIKQALLDYGPVVARMAVYSDLQRYRGGVYVHPQLPDESEDDINHAPVIVGWNDNENCWIVKNSWGKSWGEDTYDVTGDRGWFRIRYGDCFIGTTIGGVVSDVIRGNDTGKPIVNLTYPHDGWLYLFDNPIREVLFGRTKVIGSLSVKADAWDINVEEEWVTGVDRVEFYLDDVSQYIDTESPYEWTLQRNLGFHEIKIIAFDGAGNPSSPVTLDILKIL